MNSFVDFRAEPSAMLEGIDVAARRNWDTRPNNSLLGIAVLT